MDFGVTEIGGLAATMAAEDAAAAGLGASALASTSAWSIPSLTAGQLATGSLATSALGTASSIFGNLTSGNAAADAARYRAQVARNNKAIADRNASQALAEGDKLVSDSGVNAANLKSRQRIAFAASGVDPDSGSALLTQEDTDTRQAQDSYTIRSNAGKKAAGFATDALDFSAQAALDEAAAGNANLAKWLNVSTSVLGGASSLSDKWSNYKTKGVKGF